VTAYTGATNLTGHPSLSIPIGKVSCMEEDIQEEADKAFRLPVGLMLVGKFWDEATLLRIGDALEKSADWREIIC
jgi:amidase